jgi:hypothetical protein
MTTIDWSKMANDLLAGKVVKEARYLTPKEAEDLGWENRPVAIFFTDGTYVFPSQDDEGNGAGALFTSDEKVPTLPVLW